MTDNTQPSRATHAELAVRFVPQGLDERIRLAQLLAESDMLPRALQSKPANVLLVMDYADALGLRYSQAISTINIIDGKPSASAALVQRQVRTAGHLMRVSGDDRKARATITRADDPDFEYESVWTLERAAQAGLVNIVDGKPRARSSSGKVMPWEAYTAALLKARAVTEVARDAAQDALMGVQYTAEELGVIVDEAGNPVFDGNREPQRVESVVVDSTPTEAPKPKVSRKATPKARPVEEPDPLVAEAEAAAAARTAAAEPEPVQPGFIESGPEETPADPEPETGGEDGPTVVEADETDHWEDEWMLRLEGFIGEANRDGIAGLAREALNASRSDLVAVARSSWKSAGAPNGE